MIKELVHRKVRHLLTFMLFQTCVIHFLPWDTTESSHSTFSYNEAEWWPNHSHLLYSKEVSTFSLTLFEKRISYNLWTKWYFDFWVIYSFNKTMCKITVYQMKLLFHSFTVSISPKTIQIWHCSCVPLFCGLFSMIVCVISYGQNLLLLQANS